VRLLVVRLLIAAVTLGGTAAAQSVPPVTGSSRPFEITDNSFFVEEAFNQEPGIFQNIFGVAFDGDGQWGFAFTQEWPVFSQTHQISYTVGVLDAGVGAGFGDSFVHYRWQATSETASRPAFSPRISLILPTGRVSHGRGNGNAGWELNLPFSKQFRNLYLHWNAGVTHLPAAEVDEAEHNLLTPRVAGSAIVRVRPMLNLMLESVVAWNEQAGAGVTGRQRSLTVLPGFRTGWNTGAAQTIVGFAVPVTFSGGESSVGGFAYLSYELPFLRQP
jgi:hypothetical protein